MTEFKKPALKATVSPSGWRSTKVLTQQAAPSPLIDLAQSLGVASKVGQQVAGLQAFEYKQGVKEGEMAAAAADLDDALAAVDAPGEKLVEQGLMPRSQLTGYQVGFRKQTGRRAAKSNFNAGLQARLKEVELNPENANFDVIDQIIQEEETKALESLRQAGGAQLALQGFTEYSSEIKDRFKLQATELRDKAIDKFNKSMHTAELNNDFSDRAGILETEEDVNTFKADLKKRMDEIHAVSKIPKSEVIELVWNTFASPTIRGLLSGAKPQPDRAEELLNAVSDIETVKGAKLGNINREGAAIKSTATSFRDQIAKAREKIENDTPDISDRIKREYGVNAPAIAGGPTGDAAIDERSIREITAQLVHAGYSEDEAGSIAAQVYSDSDVAGYTRYLSKFLDSEDTRAAFGDAFMSFSRMRLETAQLGSMYLTNKEQEQLEDRYRTLKETNPDLSPAEFLNTGGDGLKLGPITDKQARATIGSIDLEYQKKKWWNASEAKRVGSSSYKERLRTNTEALYMERGKLPDGIKARIDQLIEPYETTFINLYNNLTRDAAAAIDPDNPDREQLMIDKEKEISEQLLGRFTRLQETIKIVETGRKRREAEVAFDADDFNEKLEEAEEDYQDLRGVWDSFFKGPNVLGETIHDAYEFGFLGADPQTLARRDYEFRQLTGAQSPMREKALRAAEKFEMSLRDEGKLIEEFDDKEAPQAYKDTVKLLRKRFGYRSIDQVPDYDPTDPLDWRLTPVFGKEEDLRPVFNAYTAELEAYYQLPIQEQNLEEDKFSTLRKMRDKFGVFDPPVRDDKGRLTRESMKLFIATQRNLFKQ
jgi:hypothetical protein